VQQVVKLPLTDQDNLDVQRDWLGFDRNCSHQRKRLAERFDANLPGPQGTLQGFPRETSLKKAGALCDSKANNTGSCISDACRPAASDPSKSYCVARGFDCAYENEMGRKAGETITISSINKTYLCYARLDRPKRFGPK
jgi:hypothetical protein